MKRLLAILCALALILPLAACTAPVPEKPEGRETAPTSLPTEPLPPPLPEQTEPVVELTCLDLPEGVVINYVVPLGAGLLTVNCSRWEYEEDMPVRKDDRTYLVDAFRDRVLGSAPGWQGAMGRRKNGEILVMDQEAEKLRFYDGTFSLLREEPLPSDAFAAIFDRERDRLCWLEQNTLRCASLEDGSESVYTLEEEAEAEVYDPATGLLVYTLPSAGDQTERDWVLYDPEKGKILSTGPKEAADILHFADGALVSVACETAEDPGQDFGGLLDLFTLYDLATGRATRRWRTEEVGYWECLSGSPYAASAVNDYDDLTGQETGAFFLVDLSAGKRAAPLDMTGKTDPGVCRDPDTGRVFLHTQEQGRGVLRVIEPRLVEYDEPLEELTLPAPPPVLPLGSAFRELRDRADAIEKEFSVRILLGDEVKNTRDPGDYTLVSLESSDRDPADLLDLTADALDTVRNALAAYPEGFFRRFRNSRGQGGLRILLVEDLENSQFESFSAAGITYGFGAWYNLALEVGELAMEDTGETVHHETWHAVERRICDLEPEAFYFGDWSALNPSGFDYDPDFDHYYEKDGLDQYILYHGGKRDEVYFVSSYSTVTDKEDRATLIQFLFSPGDVKDFYPEYDSYYQMACSYPHLKDKLDEMAKWTEKVFGCVYWEEMLDERDPV